MSSKPWLTIFRGKPRSRILAFLQLPQDLDVVLPTLQELKNRGREVMAILPNSLLRSSPRVSQALKTTGIDFAGFPKRLIGRKGIPLLRTAAALICPTESSAGPHRVAHRLVKIANRKKIPTFTMQHGLENIGLTYYDAEYPPEKIVIASQHILVWGAVSDLDPQVPASIKSRCLSLGYFKSLPLAPRGLPSGFSRGSAVLVLENLHWSRYSDQYREGFVDSLLRLASRFPEQRFILKPHHAGQWLSNRAQLLKEMPNLVLASPQDPKWEPFTAPELFSLAAAVITTPSTVAIDAAIGDLPVAVYAGDLSLSRYDPLPMIRNFEEASQFVESVIRKKEDLLTSVRKFVEKSVNGKNTSVATAQKIEEAAFG